MTTICNARQGTKINDAFAVDLRVCKEPGGEILLWHGWADGAIMPTSSIGYHKGAMKFMGSREQTEDLFRRFLIVEAHHGAGGPVLTEFDAFTAVQK